MPEIVDNPVLKVFERFKKQLMPIVGKNNVSMEDSTNIAETPYASLKLLGASGARWDLEGDECATWPTFQTDSYASGQKALTMAYEIDEECHKAMTDMGFRRYNGPRETPNIDSRIKRVTSQYRMLYTGNLLKEPVKEELEKPEEPEPEKTKAKSRKALQ